MAKICFTSLIGGNPRLRKSGTALGAYIRVGDRADTNRVRKMNLPMLADRRSYDDAATLIELYGDHAGIEAALRADQSRDRGNHIHFCHWRQIERMVVLLSVEQAIGTVH
jgi:hypothetical protein